MQKKLEIYPINYKVMKKIYQIVFYYNQLGGAVAHKSKVLFENKQNAQQVANLICEQKKLFFQLEEYYI